MTKRKSPKRRSGRAKALRSPALRQRVVPDKRKHKRSRQPLARIICNMENSE
jgi:hypothetical protein